MALTDGSAREMDDIVIDHLILRRAKLMVVREVSTRNYRLILVREDEAASVCFERGFRRENIDIFRV